MGTINPAEIIQALSSCFQHFSQIENLKGQFCGFAGDCCLMSGCCCFIQLFECTILFGTQKANVGVSVLVAYQSPAAFLIQIGGQMFAVLGIVSEQRSHVGFLWNLNLGKVVVFMTVSVCCKTLTTMPFS